MCILLTAIRFSLSLPIHVVHAFLPWVSLTPNQLSEQRSVSSFVPCIRLSQTVEIKTANVCSIVADLCQQVSECMSFDPPAEKINKSVCDFRVTPWEIYERSKEKGKRSTCGVHSFCLVEKDGRLFRETTTAPFYPFFHFPLYYDVSLEGPSGSTWAKGLRAKPFLQSLQE